MVRTQTIWSDEQHQNADLKSAVDARAAEMARLGLTDNNPSLSRTYSRQVVIHRNWQSREAAEQWIEFLKDWNPENSVILD